MTIVNYDYGHIFMNQETQADNAAQLSRRERKKDSRRAKIRDAALELFERKGFEATTVDEIAALADVGKGTFFNYFPTKQSVLADYYRRLSDEFLNIAENTKKGGAQKRFAQLFRAAEIALRREGRLLDVLFREVFILPVLSKMDNQIEDRVLEIYAGYLEDGKAAGEIRKDLDTKLAARLVGDVWSATLRSWIDDDKKFSLAESLNRKLQILFAGMQTK